MSSLTHALTYLLQGEQQPRKKSKESKEPKEPKEPKESKESKEKRKRDDSDTDPEGAANIKAKTARPKKK